MLIVEILSPSNEAETRANVWATTTIPSGQDGSWPESPGILAGGDTLELASIGLTPKLSEACATTRLAS